MKSIKLIIIFFLFSTKFSFSQEIEIPIIENVTINLQTGNPQIKWKVQNTSIIDGFIIKRFIYVFPGVLNNTFNTICTINNSNETTFEDTTTVFGKPIPCTIPQIYSVVAFKNVGNQKILSAMSLTFKTILPELNYLFCEKSIFLKWNSTSKSDLNYRVYRNKSGENPQIISTVSDTFYTDLIELNQNYTYGIEAILPQTQSSKSCNFDIFTKSREIPKFILSKQATVNEQNTIQIVFKTDPVSEITDYILYRKKADENIFSKISKIPNSMQEFIEFTDNESYINKINSYFIAAENNCPQEVFYSDTIQNIVIWGEPEENRQLKIQFNKQNNKYNNNYKIFRKYNNENFEIFFSNAATENFDDISKFYTQQFEEQITPGKFSYYVQVTDFDGFVNKSNIVEITPIEEIYLGNAFNTKDVIEENKKFKVKGAFLQDFSLTIYDRSGNIIFETLNPNLAWNGLYANGKPATAGSYMCYLKYKNFKNEIKLIKKIINLIN